VKYYRTISPGLLICDISFILFNERVILQMVPEQIISRNFWLLEVGLKVLNQGLE
jgi:hypothetical protein